MFKYHGKVVKILGSDSLLVELDLGFNLRYTIALRFFGIVCPSSQSKDSRERELAHRLKEFLKHSLLYKHVEVYTKKFRNDYYSIIVLNGTKMNKLLVRKGLAKEYFVINEPSPTWREINE